MRARAVQKSFTSHLLWTNAIRTDTEALAVRLACSLSAPCVRGIKSYDLCFRAKRTSLVSFTEATELDLSYISITHFSRICRSDSSIFDGQWLSFVKMTDASLHTFHVCHAVFFLLPLKDDTTSQPVKAWKKSIPLVFSRPMADTSSWIGIHILCSPLPNATTCSQDMLR